MTATTTDPAEALVLRRLDDLLTRFPPETTDPTMFRAAQFDLGLAWVHLPEGHGGLGVAPHHQRRVDAALAERGADPGLRNGVGLFLAAPTIAAHGTEEQKRRFLRPLFACEELWCQLFSEPGAGSDLGGLATSAVRDGDEWVLDGQKVWNTLAHQADLAIILARTDPDVPKHRGLTFFVLDMRQPGVEVRPLRQMTGEAEFNEVFINSARTPDAWRLGEVGSGWRVAVTTLMNERVIIGDSPGAARSIDQPVRIWRERGLTDAALRDRLASLWVEAEVLRLTNLRAAANRSAGAPGPEGSITKLAFAELNQRIYELCLTLLGPAGTLYGSYTMTQPSEATVVGADVHRTFLRSRANTIEGGTSEIMRNILAERVLGLPGDPRVDRDVAWRDVPRGAGPAVPTA